MATPQIIIIGAGAAGLVAAYELEQAGHRPILLDSNDHVGGRLRTDVVNGFRLDRGFQVLLSEYPEVKRYLDLPALNVKAYRPGSHVHTRQQHFRFADPLREPAQIIRSALSPVGTLRDKIKLAQLGIRLRSLSVEDCFKSKYCEQPTIDYLWSLGFSEQIVERFFRPFFAGIFLEQELVTPAAMFRFVFKMFGQGKALLPAGGIQAVGDQLASKLAATDIRLKTTVSRIEEDKVTLDSGEELSAPGGIIVACAPGKLLPQLAGEALRWKSTSNLYFYSSRRLKENRLINLVSDPTSLINTYTVLDEVAPTYKLEGQGGSLISVTLRNGLEREAQIGQAEQDLLRHSRLPNDSLRFLKHYEVRRALPILHPVAFTRDPTHSRIVNRTFLAGDHQLNGSLDAAMRSGRLAAQGLLRT